MIQTMRKGKFGRGVEICEGGPYAHGFERGGGVQIRCDTGN